jgi:hypothetical protein
VARDFTKNTSNYMGLGVNALGPLLDNSSAISMAAWVQYDSQDVGVLNSRVINMFLDGTIPAMLIAADGAGNVIVGGRSGTADPATLFSTGNATVVDGVTWNAIGGVCDYVNNAVIAYVNGVGVTTPNTFVFTTLSMGTPTGADSIGSNLSNGVNPTSTVPQVDGRIAEVAIWSTNIGASAFAALAIGISPLRISPETLEFYAPLYGLVSPEPDLSSGLQGTIGGSLPKATHARVIRDFGPQAYQFDAIVLKRFILSPS